ncbi:MAG: PP2C family protein-serine/threonine phosphatase [Bacteroidetes bacterium]|nr:PP2C family protein-serine/threonine phosphatase [Bacteroidota bacterium]MBS1943044.1 PP2C family protein-serine/threonine phosphatase [Bacteroidota bacterium]
MTRLARLNERLNLKEFQLRALLDITKAINDNEDKQELLRLYAGLMHDDLGITRLMFFENDGGWARVQALGVDAKDTVPEVEDFMKACHDIRFIGTENADGLGRFDIAIPVFHRERPLALLLIGDIDDEEQRMSPTVKHLNFIQTLTNLIAVALENKRFAARALVQERNRRELELAAEMQQMLVPKDLPDDARLQAAAWYQPHQQVGGDYYDVIRTGADEVVLCVADVSGKGMAAALLMSNFQATLRALVQRGHQPLDELVRELNANVLERARGERFITLFIGRANLGTGAMEYVNAGHNPPMLAIPGRAVEELSTGSIALGMLPEMPFVQTGTATVRQGTLLCYTDGLVEQEDALGNALDTAPVRKALGMLEGLAPKALNDAVIATFEAHRNGVPYLDDIAVLSCRFT